MNNKERTKLLLAFSNGCKYHKEFVKELETYLQSNGSATRFVLTGLIRFNELFMNNSIEKLLANSNNIERLKNISFFCISIKIRNREVNLRFLGTIYNGDFYYLCFFHEKNEKKATSYSPNIKKAKKRKDELKI